MSAYDAGLRGAAVGAGVVDLVMPGNIRDEILTIGVAFSTLDKAIQAARASLPADFVPGWAAFFVEWQTFAKNHSSWLSNTWYKSYEKALEYRKRLEDWREKFIALGGKVSTPSPGVSPGPPSASGGINWKTLLYVGAGIGAVYAATKFLGQAVEVKREIVGSKPALPAAHAAFRRFGSAKVAA
jgi:hypothetical protein